MVWFNISIGKHRAKYVPLNPQENDYPYCDENGNILTKVSGKFEKGYFEDDKGNKHEKSFRLINGKASAGFTGRIKELNIKETPIEEAEDLLIEKEFLIECETLYDELIEKNKAYLSAGYFGNGYKAYKLVITPSKLYKGFCNMKAGTTQKSEIIKEVVSELEETKKLKQRLADVELTIQKVQKVNVEDLIKI